MGDAPSTTAPARRRSLARAATVCVVALCSLPAVSCSTRRIETVNVDSVRAASVPIAMQERLVILGVTGCPSSAQLGVLVAPNTVATPIRMPEVDGTITATNLLGQTRPVDSPTASPALTLVPGAEMVHYDLADPFDGGPTNSTSVTNSSDESDSFTATIAWVSKGALKATTAHAVRQLGFPVVDIDRSTFGLAKSDPAAVIDPEGGVIGWLAGEPLASGKTVPVVPLDGVGSGEPVPEVTESKCPAARLAQLAADTSIGKVDLPALPTPTTQPPKVELPGGASFAPSVKAVDYLGNPCPTGELTVTVDSYEVTDPPTSSNDPFRISLSVTFTNDTSAAIGIAATPIPYSTTDGAAQFTVVGPLTGIASGSSVTVNSDQWVMAPIVAIEAPDVASSHVYYPEQFECSV